MIAECNKNCCDIDEIWNFAKYFIMHLGEFWEKADLEDKQKIQDLISPEGFVFDKKIVELIKIPYFITFFLYLNTHYPFGRAQEDLNL